MPAAEKIGPKEQQRIDMRIRNAKAAARPSNISAPEPAEAKIQEDHTMKNRKTKTTTKGSTKTKKKSAIPRQAAGAQVSGKESKVEQLKAFLGLPGGKVSTDIEKKFGWMPHTARAAISRLGSIIKKTKDAERGTIYSIES